MKRLPYILAGALFFSLLLSLMPWAHHLFVTGLNHVLGLAFVLLTLAIGIALVTLVFRWIKKRFGAYTSFTPASLFAMGFLSFLISDMSAGWFPHGSTYDFQIRDSYYVFTYFSLLTIVSGCFGLCCAVYYGLPKLSGRLLNNPMGYIHFWISFIAVYFLFWPSTYEGMAGMPRRYIDYSGWYSFNQQRNYNSSVSTLVMLVLAAQALFVFNCFYSVFSGKKARDEISDKKRAM